MACPRVGCAKDGPLPLIGTLTCTHLAHSLLSAGDLATTTQTRWENNIVNPDQQIGVLCLNADTADATNECAGNTPPATLCKKVCG